MGMEQQPEIPRLANMRNKVQIILAMEHYKKVHPESKEDEVRANCMREWVLDPERRDTLAAKFSEYVEAHADEPVNVHDPAALHRLLDDIERYGGEKPTSH